MSTPTLAAARSFQPVFAGHTILTNNVAWYKRPQFESRRRNYVSGTPIFRQSEPSRSSSSASSTSSANASITSETSAAETDNTEIETKPSWEDNEDGDLETFAQLPSKDFGRNQLIETNEEFKKALRQILWKFPNITHGFAYGSGVFPQSEGQASRSDMSPHPNPPEAILKWQKGGGKVIDFILATKFSQHFHSLNLNKHRDHYSFLGSLGSGAVSYVQDKFGAGVYFNPYITVNGTMIKYGIVNMDTLYKDLTEWNTLYLAGRLQKPVKILTEDPNIRLANQRNLMAAVRCSLLLLPEKFTEHELYTTIASLSYTGDPRMEVGSEHPRKIDNIVTHQLRAFRQLYSSIIYELPNIRFTDSRIQKLDLGSFDSWQSLPPSSDLKMTQVMAPHFRGNMVRRLPKAFRERLYFQYQKKFSIPGGEFKEMLANSADEDQTGGVRRPVGGPFDKRIAMEDDIRQRVRQAVISTVKWPSTAQSFKSLFTAGLGKSWKYVSEKRAKGKLGQSSA